MTEPRHSESHILAQIQLALGSRPGIRLFRQNVGIARDPTTGQTVRFGVPGMADLLCLLAPPAVPAPTFLWLEAKSQTGRLRPDQIRFRDFIAAFAGPNHYAVARSVEDAEAAIQRLTCSP